MLEHHTGRRGLMPLVKLTCTALVLIIVFWTCVEERKASQEREAVPKALDSSEDSLDLSVTDRRCQPDEQK